MPAREPRLWTIDTPHTSYVVALDDDDRLHGLHWGPRLTREQAVTLLSLPEPTGRSLTDGRDAVLDFNPASALRFGPTGLQVRFPDGTRDLEFAFTEDVATDRELTLVFTDAHYGLEARVHYRTFPDTDVLERSMTLHNQGGDPIEVIRADSATWVVPALEDYRLSRLHGEWGAETQLTRTALPFGETLIGSRRGMTGHQANPWAALDDGTASESHGRVWSAVLAWSGTWRMTIEKAPTGRVAVSTGFGHDPITCKLGAGERLETPVSAGLYTEDGFAGAAAAWHAYALAHVLPHPEEVRPVLYNSWEATEFDINAEDQIALATRAAAMGCELFVMDDGWFGARVHDRAGLGDWTPNPDRFPDGLRPLIKRVHEAGMRFGIWVEPEMVNPDSDLYRQHPDWVYHQPHRRRTEIRHQLVLNLARPDVAEWMHRWLDELLTVNEIDFLKWDMNRPFTEAGWPGEEDPDRLWFEHTRNLYRIIDRLRADHPHLRIESCSSGGGRADLGILRRTDQVWTSDNTDAADRIEIQEGFAQVLPARVMGTWVTDSPNPFTRREVPLDFRFHVAMAGALAVGGDLLSWTEAELERGAELVADYKRIRSTVQLGRRHPLKAGTVAGVQYSRADKVVVLAWRRARRLGYRDPLVALAGLDPDAVYRDERTGRVHHGAILAAHGLDLDLNPADYASTMIELVRTS
ncbi:alpha-galactosidase [Glycomyces sp. TRM65418]|uniref:alpha-galactosidase n=1 Tax=Glycomyces sp. TRM65418 TaxID=2867006 RepID=UPI001CE6EA71|nr:alpha-galactosidase [Glycomyces sp. TRM65418]MCC3761477.1 alpha-galactosidase [Glycomyces sp. TRM65418]QZD55576.1 alpha-galactosidase [Glycomyces sp. TRM65418]